MSEKKMGLLQNYFSSVIKFRWYVIALVLIVNVILALQLTKLTKNVHADAFVSEDEPALIYTDRVKEVFNLKDPIVIAVGNEGSKGVYNKETLVLVSRLSSELKKIENVDPSGIISLATESNIEGVSDGMEVTDFLSSDFSDEHISWVKRSIENYPAMDGVLVSRDGSMTLIVVELLDQKNAKETYYKVMDLVASIESELEDNRIFVSGEGATTGFLSAYIEKDAKRLNPITGVIILIILILAFYTVPATTIPLVIVAGTVNMSLGIMAFFNVEYYVITNGLIVCMIGIAVADSIHFFSEYYKNIKNAEGDALHSDIIIRAMTRIFNPVTLTSITTAVGFLSLYPSNTMPPLKYFGIYGGLAVMIAWVLTMTLTPSLVSLSKMKPSLLYKDGLSYVYLFLPKLLYRTTLTKPRLTLFIFGILSCIGIFFSTNVITNEERIENLQPTEKLYRSDKAINRAMDGTYYIDLIIETNEVDGVLEYELLTSIEKLQLFLDSEQNITKSVSIADYIKKMNQALNEGEAGAYVIPDDSNLVAQLFLLYSLSGSPTDFENIIDSNKQSTIVRAYMKSSSYLTSRELIPRIQTYIDGNMPSDVEVNISGRVLIDYHLVKSINGSHVKSVVLAFTLVILIASLLFRSLLCGLYIAVPVGLSILVVYTVMGINGIWLGIGTAMFASIAIGLSIDFAIHLMDFFIDRNETNKGLSIREKMDIFFDATGRALWFNLLTIGLGFSVLIFSTVPSLHNFGVLVSLALGTAFLSTIMLLPCLLEVFKPKFLFR